MSRDYYLFCVAIMGLMGLFIMRCANTNDQPCSDHARCASGYCDPITRRCSSPPTEAHGEQPPARESVPDANIGDHYLPPETQPSLPEHTADISDATSELAEEFYAEFAADSGIAEHTAREEQLDAQTGEQLPEFPPATSGPCQEQKPKCPAQYLCRDEVEPPQCHLQCDPTRPATCPAPHLCQVLSSGEGICVEGQEVSLDMVCNNTRICAPGLICVRTSANSSEGVCYRRCVLDQQTCPDGHYCLLIHSRNGVCLAGQAGTKSLDSACTQTRECAGGLICFTPYQQASRCAALCDAQHPCPSGQRCANIEHAPSDAGACVR
jgi:hypothetical protein